MVSVPDYIVLGLFYAGVCRAPDRTTYGKKQNELSQSVHDAINLLTLRVEPTTPISNHALKFSR